MSPTQRMIVEFFVPGIVRTAGSKTVSILWKCQGCGKRTRKIPEAPRCPECNRVSIACEVCGSRDIIPTPLYRPAGKYTKPWMDKVRSHAIKAYPRGIIHTGPIGVFIGFCMKRPKSHFGTGKNADILKDSAPEKPKSKPDLSKCVRAIEDALTGIVWKDDSQVVYILAGKHYGKTAGAKIQIMTGVEFEELLKGGVRTRKI